MKIESLREVRNNFSEVIESLEKTGPVVVTKNGKGRALLIPIDDDTDIETLVLSNSRRFWQLFDKAGSGERTGMEDLPDVDDDAAWAHLSSKKNRKG
ncbi:MAG: type II toxin-antitoxin system Phd/YefM family antitoxin [Acidobacteria bacterium]|nr:type II toxin-antitoxin system Phd/YefM family antitoxin [Acidobacteriota bacterium]